jgi:hypothetical protein
MHTPTHAPLTQVILCAVIFGIVCVTTDTNRSDASCAENALVVLILACPCALVAAAPSPVAFGTATAVRAGAVVKSPQAFEDLARCRTAVFDKTGTWVYEAGWVGGWVAGRLSWWAVEVAGGRLRLRVGFEMCVFACGLRALRG